MAWQLCYELRPFMGKKSSCKDPLRRVYERQMMNDLGSVKSESDNQALIETMKNWDADYCFAAEEGDESETEGWSLLTTILYSISVGRPLLPTLHALLERGVDVNRREGGEDGDYPLHIATGCQMPEAIQMLVNKGANVNAQSSDGTTPLMMAALRGNLAVVACLVENGANLFLRNQCLQASAWDYAESRQHTEVAEYLRRQMSAHYFHGVVAKVPSEPYAGKICANGKEYFFRMRNWKSGPDPVLGANVIFSIGVRDDAASILLTTDANRKPEHAKIFT